MLQGPLTNRHLSLFSKFPGDNKSGGSDCSTLSPILTRAPYYGGSVKAIKPGITTIVHRKMISSADKGEYIKESSPSSNDLITPNPKRLSPELPISMHATTVIYDSRQLPPHS